MIVPVAVPVDPEVMVSQDVLLLLTAHGQPLAAETAMEPVATEASIVRAVGLKLTVQ